MPDRLGQSVSPHVDDAIESHTVIYADGGNIAANAVGVTRRVDGSSLPERVKNRPRKPRQNRTAEVFAVGHEMCAAKNRAQYRVLCPVQYDAAVR